MRLKSIYVKNFSGVESAVINFADVTCIAGANWSGKTSLRQAIRLVLANESERGINLNAKQNANRYMLVRAGADVAEIVADTDIGRHAGTISASKNYETQRRETNLPVCQDELLRYALNPRGYSGAPDDVRRRMLFLMAAKEYKPEDIKATLLEAKHDPDKIERVMPHLVSGNFDAAVSMAEINIKKCRSDWGQITGETYGDKKWVDWKAPMFDVSAKDLATAEDSAGRTRAVMDVLKKQAEPKWYKCKKCNKLVAESSDDMTAAVEKLEALREEENSSQRLIVEVSSQLEHNKRAEEKTSAAYAKGKDLNDWKALQKALGPEGIQVGVIGVIIKRVNEGMQKLAAPFEKTLWLDSETVDLMVDERPYSLASEAEQFLADSIVQMVIARLSGVNVALFDRFDVLAPALRGKFLDMLIAQSANGLQSVVFGTLKKPVEYRTVKSHWMENGNAKSVKTDDADVAQAASA